MLSTELFMTQAMARPSFDSIAFGAAGTQLEGLLLASSNLNQRPDPFTGAARYCMARPCG